MSCCAASAKTNGSKGRRHRCRHEPRRASGPSQGRCHSYSRDRYCCCCSCSSSESFREWVVTQKVMPEVAIGKG